MGACRKIRKQAGIPPDSGICRPLYQIMKGWQRYEQIIFSLYRRNLHRHMSYHALSSPWHDQSRHHRNRNAQSTGKLSGFQTGRRCRITTETIPDKYRAIRFGALYLLHLRICLLSCWARRRNIDLLAADNNPKNHKEITRTKTSVTIRTHGHHRGFSYALKTTSWPVKVSEFWKGEK